MTHVRCQISRRSNSNSERRRDSSSISCGGGCSDVFQRSVFRGNAPTPRDPGCRHHHRSGYEVALKETCAQSGFGKMCKIRWTEHTTEEGSNRYKERDGTRSDVLRECLSSGEISCARCRRSNKEGYCPG